jgi:alkylation response protein AidB-like acyl-CoA dehydrogenase
VVLDFAFSEEHKQLRERCQQLAADFATRSSAHDRDASHPTENYDRLRQEGFLELESRENWWSQHWLLGHTLAYKSARAALRLPCPSTCMPRS